jgi:hypothetical protein
VAEIVIAWTERVGRPVGVDGLGVLPLATECDPQGPVDVGTSLARGGLEDVSRERLGFLPAALVEHGG